MALEHLLKKSFIAAALALTPMPAAAYDTVASQPSRPETPMARHTGVGLPIFTSDGERIGKALATGTDEHGVAVLVAEIEWPLGIGSVAVAIPTDMFVRMTDRIILAITEAEVNQRLAGADRGR